MHKAEKAIGELNILEEVLRKVNYALQENTEIIMSIIYCGQNGLKDYKDSISIYPSDICKEEGKSALSKYKERLERRISELKKEIEKL